MYQYMYMCVYNALSCLNYLCQCNLIHFIFILWSEWTVTEGNTQIMTGTCSVFPFLTHGAVYKGHNQERTNLHFYHNELLFEWPLGPYSHECHWADKEYTCTCTWREVCHLHTGRRFPIRKLTSQSKIRQSYMTCFIQEDIRGLGRKWLIILLFFLITLRSR